jgi:4-hydroxy-tetrahydrodipicolinate synthase
MLKSKIVRDDFSGVWTALVTPFRGGRVNLKMLAELVEMACAARLPGVVSLGSTGESSALDAREQEAIIRQTVKSAAGRIRVMVGAGTNNTPATIERVRRAADLGADAALVVAPYYNKPTPAGLKRHFLMVADNSPLPIVLYHIPSRCGVGIPLDLALELTKHPRIVGIKEAGGDVWRSGEIARRAARGFAVLSGDDPLTLPLLSVGAVGVISVVSNIAPRVTKRMVDAARKGDYQAALAVHRRLAPLMGALGLETNPGPIKEAMNLAGLKIGPVRMPLAPVTVPTRRAIQKALAQVGRLE